MISAATTMLYEAFGFTVASEIHLPELISVRKSDAAPDLAIRFVEASEIWQQPEEKDGMYDVREDVVSFQVPQVAAFSVRNGREILVAPAAGADPGTIRLYVLGSCMGALLLQRRLLPLHGSAVAIGGKAYGFVGDSGAGKSTLASVFLKLGYPLISDDVIAISFPQNDSIPFVLPSYPQQKLWQESLDHFGMDAKQYRPLVERETKFSVPVRQQYHAHPVPLAAVFELGGIGQERVEIKSVAKLERFPLLFQHTFRNMLIPRMGLTSWHFDTTARIIQHAGVYRVKRPADGFTAPALASEILRIIERVNQ